jgi:hypothetical protein
LKKIIYRKDAGYLIDGESFMGLLPGRTPALNVLPDTWKFHPPSGMRIVDVRKLEDLAEHADAWTELFSRSAGLTPMLSYPWMSAYFKNKVAYPESWLCLFAYEGKQLVGVFPLIAGYAYRFIKHSALLFKLPYDILHTKSVDALTLPGREEVLGVFFNYLSHIPAVYPFFSFKYVPAHSAAMIYFTQKKRKMCVIEKPAGFQSIMQLPGSAEKYRAGLSAKFRQYLNRNTRKLNELDNVNFVICDNNSPPRENIARFLEVEHKNWKGQQSSSLKADQTNAGLFADAAEYFAAYDMMHFNFLEADGKTIAGQYAIRSNRSLYVHKIGYDEDYVAFSPGNLLFNKVMEHACDSGKFGELNFMSDSPWHSKWNIEKRPLYHLFVFPRKTAISSLFALIIRSGALQKLNKYRPRRQNTKAD